MGAGEFVRKVLSVEPARSKIFTMTKTCTKCGMDQPLSAFGKHKGCKDGLRPTCKACRNSYYKEYRQEHKD